MFDFDVFDSVFRKILLLYLCFSPHNTVAGFVENELTFSESANTRQASYSISKGNIRFDRGTITAIPGSAST